MTTPAQRISSVMPVAIATLLVVVCAVPIAGGMLTYTPNIAWLLTLTLVAFNPRSWSPLAAFCIGLLQDVLFATPLGAQALLAVLLWYATSVVAARRQSQRFRMRWLEAALVLLVWHGLLWLLLAAVTQAEMAVQHLLLAGLVNALWYPLFYMVATRMGTSAISVT